MKKWIKIGIPHKMVRIKTSDLVKLLPLVISEKESEGWTYLLLDDSSIIKIQSDTLKEIKKAS